MAVVDIVLYYGVYIKDPDYLATLQGVYPTGVTVPPDQAANTFTSGVSYAPLAGGLAGALPPDPPSSYTLMLPSSYPYTQIITLIPAAANLQTFDIDVDWQSLGGGLYESPNAQFVGWAIWRWNEVTQGPRPAITWRFRWQGIFFPLALPQDTPPAQVLARRRMVCGFEIPVTGAEGCAGAATNVSRDASRTIDGMGFAWRDLSNSARTFVNPVAENQTAWWERLYIHPRVYSTSEDNFWFCNDGGEAGATLIVTLDSTGHVKVYNKGNQAYPGTLIGTSTTVIALNTWARIDMLITFNPGLPYSRGRFDLYINGVEQFTAYPDGAVGGAGGLFLITSQVSSSVGSNQVPANDMELDIDDWCSYDQPAWYSPFGITTTPTALDWLNGSHVQLIRATGFASGHSATWVGNYRSTTNNPPIGASATAVVASATPNAQLAVVSDYQDQQLGCAALNVVWYAPTAQTVTSKLGYRANGTAVIPATGVAQAVISNAFFSLAAVAQPARLQPVDLIYVKDAGVGNHAVQTLLATAEYLGTWGEEDDSDFAYPPNQGIHNNPYVDPLTQSFQAPLGNVAVWSGIYQGNANALGQDLATQFPAHFYWVRPLTGGVNGAVWYPGMVSAHNKIDEGTIADRMVRARGTLPGGSSQASQLAITGSDANANAAGVFFQWVAFSDPAMRYLISGAFAHAAGLASAVNALSDSAFTPLAAMLFREAISAGVTDHHYYKGPGHAGAFASLFSAAEANNIATFGAGTITSQATVHTDAPQTAFAAWRVNDGVAVGPLAITSYTGNGAGGTRDIAVALQGFAPLFAIVVPHNGPSYTRDPSHTATNSTRVDTGASSATAIVGGNANVLQVGVTLNAAGIVYDVFVLPGPEITGWNGNPSAPFTSTGPIMRPSDGPFDPVPPVPTPLPPECISFNEAVIELGQRLGDPTFIHWTVPECQRYLVEALRTWNAYTQTQRDRGTFSSVNATPFYDLPTLLVNTTGEFIRRYNVTDADLVTDMEYSLMEPATPAAWSGTAMFALADLVDALQKRRNRFLRETACRVTRDVTAITVAANGRLDLPGDVITVRRAAWVMANATVVPLTRDDEWGLDHYRRNWQTAGVPSASWPTAYSLGVTPPLDMQIAPPPTVDGSLDLIAVRQGAALNSATPVLMGVPDDYAWAIKFGALADLLMGPGPANDPRRAARCEERWNQGVQLATRASVILAAKIGANVVSVYSMNEADKYSRNWQNLPLGAPTKVLTTSLNLVGLTSVPNGVYTVTLDVVRNMKVPVLLTDCFYAGGNSVLEPILAYAQYLALFKEGPSQFEAAQELLQRFLIAAGATEFLDQAQAPTRGPLFQQQVQDTRMQNRKTEPEDTTQVG